MSEADPKMQAEAATEAEPAPETARKRRPWRLILMLSVPLLLLAIGGYVWLTSGRYVSTDNAYVQQDMVSVATEVNGVILQVLVRENQQVRRGDLLFRIDPRPFRIALAQAEAQIAAAEVQVNQLEARSAGMGADIAGAEANLVYARREHSRYEELLRRGFTTRSRYDEALHDVAEARERLANARAEAANAGAAMSGGGPANQPALQAARVVRDQALLNLTRTEVHAPADGIVSQTDRLQVGARGRHRRARGHPGAPRHHLCRGQLQGNRPRQHVCRPARRDQDRRLSGPPYQRPCRQHRRRHRLAILGPARAERQRQLGQGPPARAGADRHRRRSRPADDRRPLRRCHHRHARATAAAGGGAALGPCTATIFPVRSGRSSPSR